LALIAAQGSPMQKKPSELDFEEYIRQVEPAKREKSYA
jgi:hypothetical protein